MTMPYSEQLRHPNWQRKRLEKLEQAGFQCSECGEKEKTLHVHHKRYIKGRKAWEYDQELVVVCVDCHKSRHEARETLEKILSSPNCYDEQAIGLIGGYLDGLCGLEPSISDEAQNHDEYLYDLGIFASIVSGSNSKLMAQSARLFGQLTPSQESAVKRWEES